MLESIRNLLDHFKKHPVSKEIRYYRLKIISTIQGPYFSELIKSYFASIAKEGIPFSDFETEPRPIPQIKEFINALYHAEQAFSDLETVTLRERKNLLSELNKLYFHTIEHGYKASYLATHLDIDLLEIFGPEIKHLLPLFASIKEFADGYASNTATLTTMLKQYPSYGHKAGLIGGIAVDQLKPSGEAIDYDFLTQFSAVLPGYIQQFTHQVVQYSTKLTDIRPTLEQAKLDELQKKGLQLLNSLGGLQSNDFFLSLKLFYYADIIRNIIYLSMNILEQAGNLNESSQQVVRDNLAQLKYQWLVHLLGLADRIEDEALLKHGTLSKPILAVIKPLYQTLIEYTSKVVNFSTKDEDLLTLEDDKFLKMRFVETQQRINKAEQNLVKIEEAENAAKIFFDILKKGKYLEYNLIELPKEIKDDLAQQFKLLQPYFKKIDVSFYNNVIKALTLETEWLRSLNPWHWLPSPHESIKVIHLSLLKKKLKILLDQDKATQQFHIQLNRNLIQSVHTEAELPARPYPTTKTTIFSSDEAKALNLRKDSSEYYIRKSGTSWIINNTRQLNFEQAFTLYQYYNEKLTHLSGAIAAYNEFYDFLQRKHPIALEKLSSKSKAELLNLYCRFQPYLVEALGADVNVDKLLIRILTERNSASKAHFTSHQFSRLHLIIRTQFINANKRWSLREDSFLKLAHDIYRTTVQDETLKPDEAAGVRASYLIKHTEYSKAIGEFRASLFQLTALFNKASQKHLKLNSPLIPFFSSSIPFPELEDANQTLAQCQQLIAIKRIFNSLYHLEQISKELEGLNDKSTELFYVYKLVKIYGHLTEIIDLAKDLYKDPHYSIIAIEVETRAKSLYQLLLKGSEPYTEGFDTSSATQDTVIPLKNESSIRYNGLWYSLHTFMLIPEKISVFSKNEELSEEETAEIRDKTKRLVLKIEDIIASTNSYFKLFLRTPTMYKLFQELKTKLGEFATISHEAVLEHIEEINTVLFTQILLETDEWEDRLGLNPGELSGTMKIILDEFYRGLVEPLGLTSDKHLALISNLEPINQRLSATQKREQKAKAEYEKIKDDYQTMSQLIAHINRYINIKDSPLISPIILQLLEASYLKALPLFEKHKDLFALLPTAVESSPFIDNAVNSALKDQVPEQTHIVAKSKLILNYYQGLVNTYQLDEETALEKRAYLTDLKEKQEHLNDEHTNDYVLNAFNKRINLTLNRQLGLLNMHQEYKTRLDEYLQSYYNDIAELAKTSNDIDKLIQEEITKKVKQFDRLHFAKFLQLENMMVCLTQFKIYFTNAATDIEKKTSIFENEVTLRRKSELVGRLEEVALNTSLSVEERIREMKNIASDGQFQATMLAHHKPAPLTFTWLSQLVISFLKLLNAYSPQYVEHYEQLDSAIKTPPNLMRLNHRYTVFGQEPRRYNLPHLSAEESQDELPNTAASI